MRTLKQLGKDTGRHGCRRRHQVPVTAAVTIPLLFTTPWFCRFQSWVGSKVLLLKLAVALLRGSLVGGRHGD